MAAIGSHCRLRVADPDRLGDRNVLANALDDDARHFTREAPDIKAEVIKALGECCQQRVASTGVDGLMKLDIEKAKSRRVALKSVTIDSQLQDALTLIGRGPFSAEPNQFQVDNGPCFKLLMDVVVRHGKHKAEITGSVFSLVP